jgi:hypothetical protein
MIGELNASWTFCVLRTTVPNPSTLAGHEMVAPVVVIDVAWTFDTVCTPVKTAGSGVGVMAA